MKELRHADTSTFLFQSIVGCSWGFLDCVATTDEPLRISNGGGLQLLYKPFHQVINHTKPEDQLSVLKLHNHSIFQ